MTTTLLSNNRSRSSALDQVNHLAWLLDNSIRLPLINYRIGLDALVGLIPGLGDIAGLLLSGFILIQAIRLGVPSSTLIQMLGNILLETLIGVVPVVGDVFDATFKANVRNVRLLNQAVGAHQPRTVPHEPSRKHLLVKLIAALLGIVAMISLGIFLLWDY